LQLATNNPHGLVRLGHFLHRHLVLFLISVSLFASALFPIADCFDCEGPNPWGRNDAVYAIRSTSFLYWLVGASLLAGFARRRFGWTVPVAITLISCATEPLGGVPIWSLIHNEGPIVLIYGGTIGLASFFAGAGARVAVDRFRNRHPCKSLSTEKHESSVRALESALCV
jgi:hypothetical protein